MKNYVDLCEDISHAYVNDFVFYFWLELVKRTFSHCSRLFTTDRTTLDLGGAAPAGFTNTKICKMHLLIDCSVDSESASSSYNNIKYDHQ